MATALCRRSARRLDIARRLQLVLIIVLVLVIVIVLVIALVIVLVIEVPSDDLTGGNSDTGRERAEKREL